MPVTYRIMYNKSFRKQNFEKQTPLLTFKHIAWYTIYYAKRIFIVNCNCQKLNGSVSFSYMLERRTKYWISCRYNFVTVKYNALWSV